MRNAARSSRRVVLFAALALAPVLSMLASTAHAKRVVSTGSAAALSRTLRDHGLSVKAAGVISQPFFTPKAKVFTVEVADLQVYEYRSTASAQKEAARVAADGMSVGTAMVTWMAPPHFFRKQRLIAVYIGSDARVLRALTDALGPQFAGALHQ